LNIRKGENMIDFNNADEVINKLKELKEKNLPHVTVEVFRKMNKLFDERIDYATDDEREKIEEYLNTFYDDTNDGKIPKCIFNEEQPVLRWALFHGTMTDSNTGLDWRAYHYLTIDGNESRYERVLQYHPDCYDINE
jgi:hypothetical protein